MHIILLSGGQGKRLWPLSNDVRSKQFLKLLPAPGGGSESMIQRVTRQIRAAGLDASITVATGAAQLDTIYNQLGKGIDVVAEPDRRNTFAAIALACSSLGGRGVGETETIVVMPCDVFTDDGYFAVMRRMAKAVDDGAAPLVLLGVKPSEPSTKFGYIVPGPAGNAEARPVKEFVEKPSAERARMLIEEGAYWNGGVFAFKLGFMLSLLKGYVADTSYESVLNSFYELPKISFDYEVAEKTADAAFVPFEGTWRDLGDWDAFSAELPSRAVGNVTLSADTQNTHVLNELDTPLVCAGVNNLLVAAGPDGILIADKSSSDGVKALIGEIAGRPMYEERRWGWYKVIGHTDYPDGHRSLTKILHLNPGCSISYQTHNCRDEIWTFVDGTGELVIDDVLTNVGRGDVAHIKRGQKHTIRAVTPLEIIEVQSGNPLVEDDIERHPWTW